MEIDLLIVGGGAIGLSVADCALREGLRVEVLDRGVHGQEASWAGAGMLTCRPFPRKHPGQPDYYDLVLLSGRLHKEWAARLREETGIDTGYRVSGAIELLLPGGGPDRSAGILPAPSPNRRELESRLAGCRERGVRAQMLDAAEARALEPELGASAGAEGAAFFPDEAQIRNPRFVRALAASVTKRGGILSAGQAAADIAFDPSSGKVRGVRLAGGQLRAAGNVAVCAGAWSAQFPTLLQLLPTAAKIEPVRGQILCYQTDPGLAARMMTCGNHYIVPRGDGVLLVGATHEHAGFVKETTDEGRRELEQFGHAVLPALKNLQPVKSWAGLRPGMKGRHPLIGPVHGAQGLFIAAGHYRNGLTLAPATATVLLDHILSRKPVSGF